MMVVFWDRCNQTLPDRLELAQLLSEAVRAQKIMLRFRLDERQKAVVSSVFPQLLLSGDAYYAVLPKSVTEEVREAAQMADAVVVARERMIWNIEPGMARDARGEIYWLIVYAEDPSQWQQTTERFVSLAIQKGLMLKVAEQVLRHSYGRQSWEKLIPQLTSPLGKCGEDFYFFRGKCMVGLFPHPQGSKEKLVPILTSAEQIWESIEQGKIFPATVLLAPRPYPAV